MYRGMLRPQYSTLIVPESITEKHLTIYCPMILRLTNPYVGIFVYNCITLLWTLVLKCALRIYFLRRLLGPNNNTKIPHHLFQGLYNILFFVLAVLTFHSFIQRMWIEHLLLGGTVRKELTSTWQE